MRLRVLITGLLLFFLLPASASARECLDPVVGKEASDRITVVGPLEVGAREVVKNVVSVDGATTIRGQACEDVIVFGGGPTLVRGHIRGDLVSFGSQPVQLRRGAHVEGDVVYVDEDYRPEVFPGARIDGETRKFDGTEFGQELWDALFVFGILLIVGFAVSSLVLGLFLLWLAPRAADAIMEPASKSVGASIGIGLAVAIGFPIVAILVLLTVVGIPLGVVMLLALLPLYMVGALTADWILGRWIIREPRSRYLSFLVGWAILTAASFIPFLGTIVGFAATVYGLGALTVALWRARSGEAGGGPTSTTPMPAPPPVQTPLPPPPGA